MTYILGINAYHGDSSACILKDGLLIAAVEEERFRRIKHWAGFPTESIKYCLEISGIGLEDVDHVAINQGATSNTWRKICFAFRYRPSLSLIFDRFKNRRKRSNFKDELDKELGPGFRGCIHGVDHHLAHLASAFLVSPYNESVVLSVDGFGDFASTAWGIGTGNRITLTNKIHFPHSLGIFYQALTQWLGFPNYGDEYKVMGLAPYGRPIFMEQMKQIVFLDDDGNFELNLTYFRHHNQDVESVWSGGEPSVGLLYTQALIDLLGPARQRSDELTQRHMDIARSVQQMYEDAFFNILNALYRNHGIPNLSLAGGCAMNSVANGKIFNKTPFKNVYIQSAAGDAGGAIGAACFVWSKLGGNRKFEMKHSYWGPEFNGEYCKVLLDKYRGLIEQEGCSVIHAPNAEFLCDMIASEITKGKVIGWFQGRMEWGPRALGNRSILGDPRRADMKDILNLKIKRRESFRPFAPSILREAVKDWFEYEDDVPFMMQVYPIRPEKREIIPAVSHVDGSGRLQTVEADTNPLYHKLIQAFEILTGVPILLNTSFNENEPVVCRPEEALDCFLRTKMDCLVLGNWVVRRNCD